MFRSSLKRSLVTAGFLLAAALPSLAQGPAGSTLDLSANVGVSNLNGIDNHKGHPTGGASAYVNLTRAIAVGFDYNYYGLGTVSAGVKDTEHLQTYGGSLRINLLPNRVLVPYVVAGVGGNRLTATASASSFSESAAINGSYFNGGGGVSLYLGNGFGLRPELRYERQQFHNQQFDGIYISGAATDVHPTIALFYQIGSHGHRRHY